MTIRTFKMLSFFLAYPEAELVKHYDNMVSALSDEGIVPKAQMESLKNLASHLSELSLLDAQEEYVELFDRTPSLSLHLFEHVYGESRERGQAMVDLQGLYMKEGLEIDVRETPDYLPMFLEYLAILPFEEAQQCLGEIVTVLSVIKERLAKRKSPYVAVFESLEKISREKPDMKQIKEAMSHADGQQMTQDEMDDAWEEQFAFDNAQTDGAGCPMAANAVEQMMAGIEEEEMKNKTEKGKAHG